MKNKGKNILLFATIILFATVTLVFFLLKTPSPAKIYETSMNNIVELKAQSGEDLIGYGTAEMINTNGEFITNAHVVTYKAMGVTNQFENYYVRFSFENDYREVELVNYDTQIDLALLRFKELPDFKLKPIKMGDSSKLKSGETVYAIGNSQNYGISFSQGTIGIPLINIENDDNMRSVIQCDITITEGNSGGALLDKNGKLIGITTFRIKDSKGDVIYGIAYCIPINVAIEFINA